ncbi:ribonuclease P 40kDa subunit-domain-containing protein [Clohesyomyces aquaticus]|uniref:Ribonuclease P 40kDa subunit-domain-containing protein n=1 Tax=Clohesyomyces aquaticus TaxID=1231657 RepID=A0A1Y1ZCT6_9PLEO|nr:ribonuclease P 40kDa subunit-domain-containing protein [Clohesyomyces aquaticus]
MYKNDGPASKCYFTHSLLPGYTDPQNPSTKKKPFSTFNAQRFSHTLDLILPEELYALVRARLDVTDGVGRLHYARVHMKLGELLESEFFTEYIKKGNIMMLSEGRPLVDNVFSLYEGVLRIEVDRPTYERCGLQGTPIEDGGRKHQKARWVIQFDLRASNMLHGKKLFSRLEWACKNILNQSLAWLFYNFNSSSIESLPEGREPISVHHPTVCAVPPTQTTLRNVLIPKLTVHDVPNTYDEEDSLALLEWLHLVSLGSPRINSSDQINPFLSRYEVPDACGLSTGGIIQVRWRGFIPPQFVRELFLLTKNYSLKSKRGAQGDDNTEIGSQDESKWFAITAKAFTGYGGCFTVMQFAGRDTLTWECD